jgi:hypothetical protein
LTDFNSDFFKLSRGITKTFLHTVIIIDELADLGQNKTTESKDVTNEEVKTPDKSDVISSQNNAERTPNTSDNSTAHQLKAKPIIDGFAINGIICSVLKPQQEELPLQDVLTKPAESADMIIFDWSLFNDQGKAAKQMIRGLILTNPQGQLRLIAIYTAEPDLNNIVNDVHADLLSIRNDIRGDIQKQDADLEIKAGSAKIIVIAKPETKLIPQLKHKIIPFEKLPDYMIDEFTKMTHGLISNVALKAFIEIRRNSHRIISKFDKTLDAPYLSHRSMLSNTDEAEEHIAKLIESEICGILDEAKVGEVAGISAIQLWLKAKSLDSVEFAQKLGLSNRPPKLTNDEIEYILKTGIQNDQFALTGLSSDQYKKLKNSPHKYPITKMLCDPVVQDDCKLNERFAFLTTMQSYYDNTVPDLTLGTVISEETGISDPSQLFWICVQPRCDSVRLKNITAFPFLPLNVNDDCFDVIVPKDDVSYKRLKIQDKPNNLKIISFMPQSGKQRVVSQHIEGKQGYYFVGQETTKDGTITKYLKWEGEFRIQHAQRFANKFANKINRVGLNESEWFRFWAKEE